MASSLAALCELVGGRLTGRGDLLISGAATLQAVRPGELTLVDHPDKAPLLSHTKASAAVVPMSLAPLHLPAIQVSDVHQAFAQIVSHFRPIRKAKRVGISPVAFVSPTSRLGVGVEIHPGAFIGDDVEIGDRSTIHSGARILAGSKLGKDVTVFPNVVLYENTVVGARSILHAGVVIGGHGFGYKQVEGKHRLSAQLGYVEIGADVEIGANSTIDRGTYGATTIGEGTKIDNLVMIAHNCQIGRHNLLCSQVGIAGSSTTGDYVVMAGQTGVKDHVQIGDGAVLGAQSGVARDVPAGSHLVGSPAISTREFHVQTVLVGKLREMQRQLAKLQREIDSLTSAGESGRDSAAA